MSQQRPPGFLKALWFAFIGFLGCCLFRKSPSSATTSLPIPVTAKSPKPKSKSFARPTSGSVRVTHHRIPLKRTKSANSSGRSSPVCRSRSATPKRPATDPEYIFHPPPSPFPNISLSGIFATPPLLTSPIFLASDIELGRISLASPPDALPSTTAPSPSSSFRGSRGTPSPSFYSLREPSPGTPRTPSSAVIVHLDRSVISPTTMSDGSLEVISFGDRPPFPGSPVNMPDFGRLPSPWSPMGKTASSNIWMSVDGMLMNATGPVVDTPAHFRGHSELASKTAHMISLSRISTTSLYSSPSALDALGISVFVDLDEMENQEHVDTKDDSNSVPKLNLVRDENRPTLVTPRKRRDTLPSVASHGTNHNARPAKCLSTPLTKLDNVGVNHVRSATSVSSMAYELRMGLFADGRSITAFENIISLLDQASPESIRMTPHRDATQTVLAG